MTKELLELYTKLSDNDRKNEFSSLLIKIDSLLNELMNQNHIPIIDKVKNYDTKNGDKMNETELLTFFYEDLWTIKNKVLTLIIANNKGDKNE